jgi:hypothetical protein
MDISALLSLCNSLAFDTSVQKFYVFGRVGKQGLHTPTYTDLCILFTGYPFTGQNHSNGNILSFNSNCVHAGGMDFGHV